MNKPLDAELWPTTFQFNREDAARETFSFDGQGNMKRGKMSMPPKKRVRKVYSRMPKDYHAAYKLKQREAWLRCGAVKPRTEAERAIAEGI